MRKFKIVIDDVAIQRANREAIRQVANAVSDFMNVPDARVQTQRERITQDTLTYWGEYPEGAIAGTNLEHSLMKIATRGLYRATHHERTIYI